MKHNQILEHHYAQPNEDLYFFKKHILSLLMFVLAKHQSGNLYQFHSERSPETVRKCLQLIYSWHIQEGCPVACQNPLY